MQEPSEAERRATTGPGGTGGALLKCGGLDYFAVWDEMQFLSEICKICAFLVTF